MKVLALGALVAAISFQACKSTGASTSAVKDGTQSGGYVIYDEPNGMGSAVGHAHEKLGDVAGLVAVTMFPNGRVWIGQAIAKDDDAYAAVLQAMAARSQNFKLYKDRWHFFYESEPETLYPILVSHDYIEPNGACSAEGHVRTLVRDVPGVKTTCEQSGNAWRIFLDVATAADRERVSEALASKHPASFLRWNDLVYFRYPIDNDSQTPWVFQLQLRAQR